MIVIQPALYLLGICRMYDMFIIGMFVMVACILYAAVCLIIDALKQKSIGIWLIATSYVLNVAINIMYVVMFFSPAVSAKYNKIYKPYMFVSDTIILFLLISISLGLSQKAITDRVSKASAEKPKAEQMAVEFEYLATRDSLSQLWNHKAIMEQLDICCNGNEPFVLGCLDLDDFCNINNTYGYQIGD
ncbi:diguanylate cyclase [Enterocloster sp. OA11]|uniref:GGDEF domain-containing protein n=3 Tax=Clostridia TaxID=186801 RepID=UPI000E472425|nr:diguanylate cyclase [Enterocloster sp. OA11]MCH1934937.1 diguanylate cyclase [Enterocloster sp. OA11]RHB66089.1 diguanylate cyclase [Hungatella hathewayi]